MSIGNSVTSKLEGWANEWFGVLAFPVFSYMGAHWLLDTATGWGLVAGFIVAVMLLVVCVILLRVLPAAFKQRHTGRYLFSVLTAILLVSAGACAYLSFMLERQGWASYDTTAWEFTTSKLVDYYIWHFVDMIPAIKVWDTLGVDQPFKAQNAVAGAPVLAFRTFIVLPLVMLIRPWLSRKPSERQ